MGDDNITTPPLDDTCDVGRWNRQRPVRMLDVAKLAGVSTATVSRILTGAKVAKEQTQERVLAAVAQLQYRPNQVARALRRQETKTVGLIVPDMSSPLATAIFHELDVLATTLGVAVLVANSGQSAKREEQWLETLAAKAVDVIVLWPVGGGDPVRRLLNTGQFIIQIVTQFPDPISSIPSLVSDFQAAGRLGLQHLWRHGHKQIAVLTSHHSGIERELEDIRHLVADRGPGYDIEVAYADGDEAEAQQRAIELLRRKPSPSALFVLARHAAAHQAARILKLSVPSELAVVAFSDRDWLAYVEPPVTAVHHDSSGITSAMVSLLEKILSGERVEPIHQVFPPKLVIRASCGCKFSFTS
jgi:DNA-binding LacI/PurR family transcriptional regulator